MDGKVHHSGGGSPVRHMLTGLLLLFALFAGYLPGATPARAVSLYGHDISWPQCPTAVGGFGLPLPPASSQFVVIGLTKGLPFTENPCLASQVAWAADNRKPAQAYTMAAFPTPRSSPRTGPRGRGPQPPGRGSCPMSAMRKPSSRRRAWRGSGSRRAWCGSTSSPGPPSRGQPRALPNSAKTGTSSKA